MGRISARFQTEQLTVWPVNSRSDMGRPEYGAPFLLRCEYSQNNRSTVDDDGVEFIPSWTFFVGSTTMPGEDVTYDGEQLYYDGQLLFFSSAVTTNPLDVLRGYLCALGDYTGSSTPTADAKPIRAVRIQQNLRRQGSPDVTLYCGS